MSPVLLAWWMLLQPVGPVQVGPINQGPTAGSLQTTGAKVVVATAAPPTTGQVLTATSATAATWQTASGGVASSRAINTTAPLTGGGDLSADRTLACATCATAAAGGSLTTAGAFAVTLTATGATGVTLPTSGTLATTAQLPSGTNTGDQTKTCTNQAITVLAAGTGSTCSAITDAFLSLSTPSLGVPSLLTLTNATGLPIGAITGGTAACITFLVTPTSANLLACLSDETGTGKAVFDTAPTFNAGTTFGDGSNDPNVYLNNPGWSAGCDHPQLRFKTVGSVQAGVGLSHYNGTSAFCATTFNFYKTNDGGNGAAVTAGSLRTWEGWGASGKLDQAVSDLTSLSTSGTTTNTGTSLVPASSIVLAIETKVTTTITTATDFGVALTSGIAACTNPWVLIGTTTTASTAITAGSKKKWVPAAGLSCGVSDAGAVTITYTTTGTPGAGAIRTSATVVTLTAAD